jgi:O-antigen ligase
MLLKSPQTMSRPGQRVTAIAFALVLLVVVALVSTDQYTSTIISPSFWAKFRMTEFPYRMTVLALVLILVATCIYLLARRAADTYVLLTVIALIGLQSNGIKLGGFDVITIMPFLVILFVLAKSFQQPAFQIALPGVMFFGLLLLLLDIPYLAFPHIHGPGRFIINFISLTKGMMVAFIFINLIRTERHLAITIQAFMVVAFISALIGIGQIALNYFTGITINFASEAAEWKPNFLGMSLRATGLTSWPSWLSDFLVLALPFMLFRLVNAQSIRWRALYAIAILALLGAIFLTFTYAAYFAAVLVLAIFPFLCWPQKSVHFVVTLLMVGALFQIGGGFEWAYEHGLSKVTQSTGMIERRTYLQSTLNEIARDPWIGSGLYAEEEFSENFYRKRVHNTGLQAWAGLGLPGLLVFVAMMLTMLAQLWLMSVALRGQDRQLFQALGLGMGAMILEMFAEPNLTAPITWFYLGLCQAALLVYCTWRYPRAILRMPDSSTAKRNLNNPYRAQAVT